MVPDPYKALGVSHSASALEIKRAYRANARKYHPDKYVLCENEATKQAAAAKFAACASAYALLSDAKRKSEYDHIYKYGGYDDDEEEQQQEHDTRRRGSGATSDTASSRKRKSSDTTGIGYSCYDPFAFLFTQGQIQGRRTVAGIKVPSRMSSASNLRFAYSSGQIRTSPSGTRQYTSHTTQFTNGRKYTLKETVTYHPDGRKEVVIEGDDSVERRYSRYNVSAHQQERSCPWYLNAWRDIKDKLSMCYNPCAVVKQ